MYDGTFYLIVIYTYNNYYYVAKQNRNQDISCFFDKKVQKEIHVVI